MKQVTIHTVATYLMLLSFLNYLFSFLQRIKFLMIFLVINVAVLSYCFVSSIVSFLRFLREKLSQVCLGMYVHVHGVNLLLWFHNMLNCSLKESWSIYFEIFY
jgi:hypothetical protein